VGKRMTNAEIQGIIWLIIIGIPIWLFFTIGESVGWIPIGVIAAVGVVVYILIQQHNKKQRLQYLRDKYQDEELVQKIFNGYFWQEQTDEQLIDAIGKPNAVDEKQPKQRRKRYGSIIIKAETGTDFELRWRMMLSLGGTRKHNI